MIRLLTQQHVEPSNDLFCLAKLLLRNNNIDQWQGEYPNNIDAVNDILHDYAYGYFIDERLVGYMALVLEKDPNYDVIDGAWITNKGYYCVHRLCVDPSFKGQKIGQQLLEFAIKKASDDQKSLRVDTHQDNLTMQALLNKCNFKYCGIITLIYDGTTRYAYELNCGEGNE